MARRSKNPNLKRVNPQTIRLNNLELSALNNYCNKYRVANKSKFMRETIMVEIIKKFEEDYPSLFEEPTQPTLFDQKM